MSVLWRAALALCCFLVVRMATAADLPAGPLVTAEWLRGALNRSELVVLDASPPPLAAKGRIPGAIAVNVFDLRVQSAAKSQERLRALGISARSIVVVTDQGGSYLGPRLHFDLAYAGFPEARLFLLDGGMARWRAIGGPVSAAAPTASTSPARGDFAVRERPALRATLADALAASGDRAGHALIDALDLDYFYGGARFFDRRGHLPNALALPAEDLFNPDKTFKSPQQIRALLGFLGIRPEQQVITYCGGGIAAAGPYFAIRHLAGYERVKLYLGSQLEWVRDERGLPLWTDARPALRRSIGWLNGWNQSMLRQFGVAGLSVVDVRPRAAYDAGHIPFALHVPAAALRERMNDPQRLAELLGAAGVNPTDEAVIVGERGLDADVALAWRLLTELGQARVSFLDASLEEWAMQGAPLTRVPTEVGAAPGPDRFVVPAVTYRTASQPATGKTADAAARPPAGAWPQVVWHAGAAQASAAPTAAGAVGLPVRNLVGADGRLGAAHALWTQLAKAGLPRYAEVTVEATDPGERAQALLVLQLLGHPGTRPLP
jgi:3-mercaptopyruvate sulfurtransferase SseA